MSAKAVMVLGTTSETVADTIVTPVPKDRVSSRSYAPTAVPVLDTVTA